MKRAFQTLIWLGAALGFGACFNFGDYKFSDDTTAGVGGATAPAGAGGAAIAVGGAGDHGGAVNRGGSGGNARCVEDPSACQLQQVARERGATCLSAIDCDGGFCVDGVCCEEACEGPCAACNVPGQLGFCRGISNDDSCATGCLPSSACLEYRQTDAATTGNCASRGVCRPNGDCARFPLAAGTACGTDLAGSCDGSGACKDAKKPLGAACESADECTEGFCAATATGSRVCCNQACNLLCQECSPLGTCSDAPATDPRCPLVTCGTDDICNDYPDSPEVARCAGVGVCVAGEVCAPTALRPASECTCTAAGCTLSLGARCSNDEDCDSGFCAGGVCCSGACDGNCEQCDAAGQCGRASTCECTPGDRTTCGNQFDSLGECAARTITCDAQGEWPSQVCRPQSAELCDNNGKDEDCDGNSRNGCQCLNGTVGSCRLDLGARGVCADRPAIECQNGRWPEARCAPSSDEICRNNRDDNCNGRVDEQPPCGIFDPSACDFSGRPECDAQRCTRCNGCQDCVDIVECVAATSPLCVTAADPVCGTNSCADQVANGNANAFGEFQPTESAREYIECVCAR